MSSAPTLEQYLSIDTNFDPPLFSLDNTFNGETCLKRKLLRALTFEKSNYLLL
jgi:hypothetical protein